MALFSTKSLPASASPPAGTSVPAPSATDVPISAATPVVDPAPPRRAMAAVATRTIPIEQTEPFQCQSEVNLGQMLFQIDQNRIMHAATSTADLRLYTLDNVVLDGDSLLMFHDGALIAESDYFVPPQASRTNVGPGTHPTNADDAEFVIGYNNIASGYQSWLTHCVPAIDWSLRQPSEHPVRLLLPHLEPWQNDFLRLLGHDAVPRFTPAQGARYHLKHARFADFLIGTHRHAVSLTLHQTAQRILDAVPQIPTDAQIIYVPGTHYYYGTLVNEADAIGLLRQEGVHVIEPTLTTEERINLFRHADVVIGPLGQGLSDVMFCRPGTLLWEWMPRHHLNPAFNRLAQAAGVDYLGDVFPLRQGAAAGSWDVQLEIVRHRFGQIRNRLVERGQAAAAATAVVLPEVVVEHAEPQAVVVDQPAADVLHEPLEVFAPMPTLEQPQASIPPSIEHPAQAEAETTDLDIPASPGPEPIETDVAAPRLEAESVSDPTPEVTTIAVEQDRPRSAMDYLSSNAAPPMDPAHPPRKSFFARMFGR